MVATPNAGAKEVLADGEFGVLTRPENLGTELADLLLDNERMIRLAAAALARSAVYDWSAVCAAYEEVYSRLLERRRK